MFTYKLKKTLKKNCIVIVFKYFKYLLCFISTINADQLRIIYNKNKNNTLDELKSLRIHEIRSPERTDSFESFIVIDDIWLTEYITM